MTYAVKEIFYTLQGEGANAGRPAVFCRFAGCNLWSGREEDRAGAMCRFCDTDFVGRDGENGGKYRTADALAAMIAASASAVLYLPPFSPSSPTKSVSQKRHIAPARSSSRPDHRLHPANR